MSEPWRTLPCKLCDWSEDDGEACILFGVTDVDADLQNAKWSQAIWMSFPSEAHANEFAKRWNSHADLLYACGYLRRFLDEYDTDNKLHPSLRQVLDAAIAKATT